MNKKLTDSEIIKALEDVLHRINGATRICVPQKSIEEFYNVLQNALDLINHLQAENTELLGKIEQLKNDKVHIASDNAYFQSVIQNLEAEVERLKAQLEGIKYGE